MKSRLGIIVPVVFVAVVVLINAWPSTAAGPTESTIYACRTATGTLNQVRFDHAPTCKADQVPVRWQGVVGNATPTPTPTPSPTPTATPTPNPSPTPAAWSCVRERSDGNVGCPETGPTPGYIYPRLPNSNGYTTYVNKDCWANPGCQYLLEANNPGDWQVTANEPAGNTSVRTYPDAQQLTNNWCPNDPGYKDCPVASTDTPISQLTTLTSTYAETTPSDSGVIAQFAWDIWTSNNSGHPNEIMIWVDNHNRGSGGATQVGTATVGGQAWTIYQWGTDELIWSLGAPGTFAQQTSGTVDLLAILNESIRQGFTAPSARLAQINAGWEICSTGGMDRTFRVTDYAIDAVPA